MFESIMWKYMEEETSRLNVFLLNNNIKVDVEQLNKINTLYFVAHGSSYNAAVSTAPFISKLSQKRVYVYTPSNFRYNCHSLYLEDLETTAVIGISQTGTSRGVLEALKVAKDKGYKIIGITNEKNSPIDVMSDLTIYLNCGPEDSNAKTKGYSSTLLALMILGIELSDTDKDSYYDELKQQINSFDEVRSETIKWCKEHDYGKKMNNIYILGNGMNFGSALEGQLKIMETMCIPTMFNDIEEFSHGMHRSINKDSNVVLIDTKTDHDLTVKTNDYLKNKGVNVLVINGFEDRSDDNYIDVGFYEKSESVLSVIAAIQTISAFIPENNGIDPNRSANNDYTDCAETRV